MKKKIIFKILRIYKENGISYNERNKIFKDLMKLSVKDLEFLYKEVMKIYRVGVEDEV